MKHRVRRLVAVLALLPLTALVACSGGADRPDGGPLATSPRSQSPSAGRSAAPSGSPSATGTPTPNVNNTGDDRPSGTRQLAVYYVGEATQGLRLYREFRAVPRYRTAVRSAVDAMLHVAPKDPDYRSLWPRGTQVRGVSITGATATVDLSREALRGSGAEAERMSVQQLVHTVTAAAPAVTQVRVLVEGRSSGRVDGREIGDLWGHGGLRNQPLRRGPQTDVLAPVWITSHLEGQTVGLEVSFGGSATVFEATVSWQIRSACPPDTGPCPPPTVYREGFSTASRGAPERGEWLARTTIPRAATAFRYVEIRAFESSAEDGRPTDIETKVLRLRSG